MCYACNKMLEYNTVTWYTLLRLPKLYDNVVVLHFLYSVASGIDIKTLGAILYSIRRQKNKPPKTRKEVPIFMEHNLLYGLAHCYHGNSKRK